MHGWDSQQKSRSPSRHLSHTEMGTNACEALPSLLPLQSCLSVLGFTPSTEDRRQVLHKYRAGSEQPVGHLGSLNIQQTSYDWESQ